MSQPRLFPSLALATAALLGLAACGDGGVTIVDTANARSSLLDADRAFSRMSEAEGAQAAFMHFAHPDVVLLPARGEPVRGLAGVELAFSSFRGQLTWEPQDAHASGSADLGVTWGFSTLIDSDADGQQTVSYGKYATVWKRNADGEWRFVMDIGNESSTVSLASVGEGT